MTLHPIPSEFPYFLFYQCIIMKNVWKLREKNKKDKTEGGKQGGGGELRRVSIRTTLNEDEIELNLNGERNR